MKSTTLWVGLDVHKESISVAVVDDARAGRPVVTITNEPTRIRKVFSRQKKEGEVRACYEAGSCGYEVYRQLATMGVACDVVAPGLGKSIAFHTRARTLHRLAVRNHPGHGAKAPRGMREEVGDRAGSVKRKWGQVVIGRPGE